MYLSWYQILWTSVSFWNYVKSYNHLGNMTDQGFWKLICLKIWVEEDKNRFSTLACLFNICFCQCSSSTIEKWLACLIWENISQWTQIIYNLQNICHLYRPHHYQMMAIYSLFDLESDTHRSSAVPGQKASA